MPVHHRWWYYIFFYTDEKQPNYNGKSNLVSVVSAGKAVFIFKGPLFDKRKMGYVSWAAPTNGRVTPHLIYKETILYNVERFILRQTVTLLSRACRSVKICSLCSTQRAKIVEVSCETCLTRMVYIQAVVLLWCLDATLTLFIAFYSVQNPQHLECTSVKVLRLRFYQLVLLFLFQG